MRILDIHTVERKGDSLISYRRQYTAQADVEHVSTETVPIRFTIEQSATGAFEVSVDIEGDLGYPLLPVLSALKSEIRERDRQGRLP